MSSQDPIDWGVLLNLAFASFRHSLDADLAAAGYRDLGPSFGYVFRRLGEGPCSLSELAQHLSMTAPGALKMVAEMVAKGYVERSDEHTDRRVKLLHLTARGQAALDQARQFHQRYEQLLCARLGQAQVRAARSVLEDIVFNAPPAAAARLPRPS